MSDTKPQTTEKTTTTEGETPPPPKGPLGDAVAGAATVVGQITLWTGQDPILQFFKYDHLSGDDLVIFMAFGELAAAIVAELPRNPERTVALRKLLESRDAAVRAKLFK